MAEVLLFAGERAFFSDSAPTALRYLLHSALHAEQRETVEALRSARQVLEKLLELGPGDEIGGGAFLHIARSFAMEEAE